MELVDKRPDSARFTSAREVTIVSELGNMCAAFQPGQTLRIPRTLFNAALTAGLIPEDPLELAPEPVKKPPQEETVKAGLKEACQKLILRGNPKDFTTVGLPRAASAKKLVDFDFTAAELRTAFEEAMHEVEQDGDDSTQHSEPSSVAAE
jgi:hypothetical protein